MNCAPWVLPTLILYELIACWIRLSSLQQTRDSRVPVTQQLDPITPLAPATAAISWSIASWIIPSPASWDNGSSAMVYTAYFWLLCCFAVAWITMTLLQPTSSQLHVVMWAFTLYGILLAVHAVQAYYSQGPACYPVMTTGECGFGVLYIMGCAGLAVLSGCIAFACALFNRFCVSRVTAAARLVEDEAFTRNLRRSNA